MMEKLYRIGQDTTGPIVRVISWGDICHIEIVEEGYLPGPMGGFVWSKGSRHPVVRGGLYEVRDNRESDE